MFRTWNWVYKLVPFNFINNHVCGNRVGVQHHLSYSGWIQLNFGLYRGWHLPFCRVRNKESKCHFRHIAHRVTMLSLNPDERYMLTDWVGVYFDNKKQKSNSCFNRRNALLSSPQYFWHVLVDICTAPAVWSLWLTAYGGEGVSPGVLPHIVILIALLIAFTSGLDVARHHQLYYVMWFGVCDKQTSNDIIRCYRVTEWITNTRQQWRKRKWSHDCDFPYLIGMTSNN